jgi:hypothetical protein
MLPIENIYAMRDAVHNASLDRPGAELKGA